MNHLITEACPYLKHFEFVDTLGCLVDQQQQLNVGSMKHLLTLLLFCGKNYDWGKQLNFENTKLKRLIVGYVNTFLNDLTFTDWTRLLIYHGSHLQQSLETLGGFDVFKQLQEHDLDTNVPMECSRTEKLTQVVTHKVFSLFNLSTIVLLHQISSRQSQQLLKCINEIRVKQIGMSMVEQMHDFECENRIHSALYQPLWLHFL